MKGFNVLHPMGFDSFGLPTERYSMTTGIHPAEATKTNIERFKEQLRIIGLGYDWEREIATSNPDYYKWTQWIFLLLYNSWYCHDTKKSRPIEELPIPREIHYEQDINQYIDSRRLAFIANIPVNWCEELSTVLANEEVEEWRSKGYTVIRKPVRQWMLRITEYADRLLEDLALVQWPNSTKEMQINWIGKSEGAEIQFPVLGEEEYITVFTTRPDTVFGATYLVIAPELPLVDLIASPDQKDAIEEYRTITKEKNDIERTELIR
jgi:leucyl-tRNA synthetase